MTVQTIGLSDLSALFTAKSAYLLAYSWLFGMSIWISFFGGVIAYKSLPRHQFGALQHRTFPIYFLISIALSTGLLASWTLNHPEVKEHFANPLVADVLQAYTLASVLLGQGSNYFVVGPLTSRVMFQRQKREKEEGKTYNEPGVSADMKVLNTRFAQLHGISSLANLGAVIALGFHGLWIGNFGKY